MSYGGSCVSEKRWLSVCCKTTLLSILGDWMGLPVGRSFMKGGGSSAKVVLKGIEGITRSLFSKL